MIIIPENLHLQNLACAAWQAQKVVGVGVRWEGEKRESGEKRREPLTLSPQTPPFFPSSLSATPKQNFAGNHHIHGQLLFRSRRHFGGNQTTLETLT